VESCYIDKAVERAKRKRRLWEASRTKKTEEFESLKHQDLVKEDYKSKGQPNDKKQQEIRKSF